MSLIHISMCIRDRVEHYGTLELVNEKAGATCEIIANLFRCADIALSQTCASFLYQGLLMDTARFSIAPTTKDSFLAAAYLCEAGIELPTVSYTHLDVDKRQPPIRHKATGV